MKAYVVRMKLPDGSWHILSAWPDVYYAKFEAQRWEQDLKVEHDYVEATLELEGDNDSQATSSAESAA